MLSQVKDRKSHIFNSNATDKITTFTTNHPQTHKKQNASSKPHLNHKKQDQVEINTKHKELQQNIHQSIPHKQALVPKMVQLVQKFVKSIELQIKKSITPQTTNTIHFKLDGLNVHRLKEINKIIFAYKNDIKIINPEIQPNNVVKSREQEFLALLTRHNSSKLMQTERMSQQIVRCLKKSSPLSHFSNLSLPQLVTKMISRNQELQKQKSQLQTENKKIRLFYLNQLEQYKQQVKFIHQILQHKDRQLKLVEMKNLQKKSYVSNCAVTPGNGKKRQHQRQATHFSDDQRKSGEQLTQNNSFLTQEKEKHIKQQENVMNQLTKQIHQKKQELTAVTAEISLLLDNLTELIQKVEQKQKQIDQQTGHLQHISGQIDKEARQLKEMQQKLACLQQQVQVEQQNLDYIQQQIQFMERQKVIIQQQIQELNLKRQQILS